MAAHTKGKTVDKKTESLIREAVTGWFPPFKSFNFIRVKDLAYGNRYRVDVFAKKQREESFMHDHWIEHSYFVEVTEFGTVVDRTTKVENPRWGV